MTLLQGALVKVLVPPTSLLEKFKRSGTYSSLNGIFCNSGSVAFFICLGENVEQDKMVLG